MLLGEAKKDLRVNVFLKVSLDSVLDLFLAVIGKDTYKTFSQN